MVTFNAQEGGVQKLQNGSEYVYPAIGFGGTREINGHSVRCLTPEVQTECHDGYEPDEQDRQDMRLLQENFGIGLHSPYA